MQATATLNSLKKNKTETQCFAKYLQKCGNIYETFRLLVCVFLQLYRVPSPVGKDQKLSVLLTFHYLQAGLSTLRSFSNVPST